MRILLLPAYFFPEQAASSFLAENKYQAFANKGFDMVTYVPTPCRGISKERRIEYRAKNHRSEVLYEGRMELHRFSMFSEGRNAFFRAFRYSLCWLKQFNRGLFTKGVSCIYLASTPPIQGLLGALLSKLKRVPFVYNLQDIFPDSLVGTGMTHKGSIMWKIGRKIESFTYRNADKIIVISEDFKKNIMAKGVPEEKIVVIYNWVDQNAVVDIPREENKLFDTYELDRSRFYLCYSGNIGLTQNMDMLLDVMGELQEEAPDIKLVLIGEGAYKEEVVKKIAGQVYDDGAIRGTVLPNVVMLPFQPYEDISYVFSLGDVGLVISKPGVGVNSVPSKTWSIMSASRPVLASFDENELKDIVADHECGIFTKAGDKESFKKAILTLYQGRELCKELGHNGRRFVMDNLTREVGTQKYVDVIKGFV